MHKVIVHNEGGFKMNKFYLTLCTLSLSFVVSTSVSAAIFDSMTIGPSYKSNNKHGHTTRDYNVYDPNHETNDRNNILTNTNNDLFNIQMLTK